MSALALVLSVIHELFIRSGCLIMSLCPRVVTMAEDDDDELLQMVRHARVRHVPGARPPETPARAPSVRPANAPSSSSLSRFRSTAIASN